MMASADAVRRWNDILAVVARWSHLGVDNQINGTRLVGHVPHAAPLAYLHCLYRGLNESEVSRLERKLGATIPDDFRELLSLTNGVNLFSNNLVLCGAPRSLARMAFHAREPFELEFETLHTRNIPGILCIGALENERLYCKWKTGPVEVFSAPKGHVNARVNTWPDLWAMLSQEVARLANEFDDTGRRRK